MVAEELWLPGSTGRPHFLISPGENRLALALIDFIKLNRLVALVRLIPYPKGTAHSKGFSSRPEDWCFQQACLRTWEVGRGRAEKILARSTVRGRLVRYSARRRIHGRCVLPQPSGLNLFNLERSCALVTGGGGALGRAMAEALRDAGARVAVVGRSNRILDLGRDGFCCLQADLTEPDAPAKVMADVVNLLGNLDILVSAHGAVAHSPAETFPLADWNRILSTNLTSLFQMAQAAAAHFLPRGRGKIINIASMLSFSGGLRVSPYAASKGGVAQLTKALANEWAPRGINVNAIAPGYFTTPMTEPLRSDPVRNQQILDRLPVGRWGDPNDLKGAVIFLASAASDYVHGIVLPVDGGWLSR